MAIRTVWTADVSQADRAVAQMERATERLERQIRQTVSGSKDSGRAAAEYGAQARKSYGDVNKRLDELHQRQNSLLKQKESLKQSAREQAARERELSRAAKQVYDDTRTPAERYAAQMEKLNRLVREGRISHETYRRAARQAHQEMTTGMAAASGGVRATVREIGQMAAAWISVQKGIQLAKETLEDYHRVQLARKEATITLADAQLNALRNLGVVSEREQRDFARRVEQMAITPETAVKGGQATLYQAMASALSASGGDVERSMAAVGVAAQMAPESAESIESVAGALLDLGKATKSTDAMENLGFLVGMAQQARATSVETVAQFGARAVSGIYEAGGTAGEAGALVTAMSQAMTDPTMRQSGTAALKLANQLGEFFQERQIAGAETPLERIEYMRARPELAREFYEQASWEEQAKGAVQQMLGIGRSDTAYQFLQQALPKMLEGETARTEARQMLRDLRRPFAQQLAAQERLRENLREYAQTATASAKASAVAAQYGPEAVEADLEAMGVPWARRKLAGAQARITPFFGADPATIYAEQMREVMEEQAGRPEETRWGRFGGLIPPATADPEAAQQAARLREQALRATQRQQDAILSERLVYPSEKTEQWIRQRQDVEAPPMPPAAPLGRDAVEEIRRGNRELIDELRENTRANRETAAETRRVAAAVANAGDRTATATQAIGRQTSDAAVQNALRPKGGSGEW